MNYVNWAQFGQHIDILAAALRAAEEPPVGVVGIPRSGMIAASALACRLGVPCVEIDSWFAKPHFHENSCRYSNRLDDKFYSGRDVILLDDSLWSGNTMRFACRLLGGGNGFQAFEYGRWRMIPVVLYSRSGVKDIIRVKETSHPRIFAWNWNDCGITEESLWDFDGVLCDDIEDCQETPDEQWFIDHLKSVPPYILPGRKIQGIVTHRLSKYRGICEEWLGRHGVEYGSLIMREETTADERRRNGQSGTWKGVMYQGTSARLFVESDLKQAQRIAEVSGKPVLHPGTDQLITDQLIA